MPPTDTPLFHRTSDVFVAGKQPTITYNPRGDRHLEQEVRGYLDQLGKALSVSGPTKSGKTVLIERLLPRGAAIWIQGSDLESVGKLWQAIAEALGAYDSVGETAEDASTEGRNRALRLGIPKAADVEWGGSRST